MTAPTAAPASGPMAPAAPRPAPHAPADPYAFGAMLDSLPGAKAKVRASSAEDQPVPSNESPQEGPSRGQPGRHSLLNDSTLLAALPFALRAASLTNEGQQAAGSSPSLASPAMNGPKSEDGGASIATGAKTAAVGRLVGERAFHFGSSTFASRTFAANAPFAPGAASADLATQPAPGGQSGLAAELSPAQALSAKASVDAVVPVASPASPTPIVSRAGASSTHRMSAARAAAHEATSSIRASTVSAPPTVAQVAPSTPVHAPAETSGDAAADGRSPDPTLLGAPQSPQTDTFGVQLAAPFSAGASFQLDGSTASAGQADITPRASPLATGATPSTSPIKEIDVDLSPGGLEDVSMTMRLTGDKLSVVVRAASSHTLNSIESVRDAIADRMAAIGQPLDSLVFKQTGANTDGNANGNPSSADRGSGGEQRSAQGSSERGDSNDAHSRRSAGRDRSF